MNAPGDQIIHANGVDLCVETFGNRADPALLLIHGAGSTMLSWSEELCARLAAGGRFVIRADSRDAGRSVTYAVGAPPYSLDDLVVDATALLDDLGVARAHFAGMSAGAGIAQRVALDHPERVRSLTLASTTPGNAAHSHADLPGPTDAITASFADPPPAPDWSDRAAVIDYLVEGERPYAVDYDEPAGRELAGRVFDRAADIEASTTNQYLAESGGDWRDRLGAIAAPTLVVHGDRDPFFPLEHGRALAREILGAELVVMERTGHEYFPRHTWDAVIPRILALA